MRVMIDVKHVTKTYGKKRTEFVALQDISISIPEGTSIAIVGKSGSGKSTLMHAMSGLDRPQAGEVIINGRDILRLTPREIDLFRAKSMGFIFQSFFVEANESCYDNVSLACELADVPQREHRQRVIEALTAVELQDKITSRARELSGGQKQRLAIARAIVGRPAIIFADEPTGNLDSATGKVVEDLLFDYSRSTGATLIVVTHDHDLAGRCDKQVFLHDGKITKTTHRHETHNHRSHES